MPDMCTPFSLFVLLCWDRFLSLTTSDVWGQILVGWGRGGLSCVGCLASTHYMLVASITSPGVASRNVSSIRKWPPTPKMKSLLGLWSHTSSRF